MFKGLKDKITSSDSNNRNKNSSVNDVDANIDVSDLAQSTTRNIKKIEDSESISEYNDSVSNESIINKEDLFKRYQKAQALAKRYKIRSVEAVESYKKLEWENTKLIQNLTDSQDLNIKRVAELKEQLELDKKAKMEIEENCRLMIEEKNELINVLRLQISILRDGTEVPTAAESPNNEKDQSDQKKKDDEINDLRSIAIVTDSRESNEPLNEDSVKGNEAALERIEKEHDENIRKIIVDFEEKKAFIESEITTKFEKELIDLKDELDNIKVKMIRVCQDNERLEEQVNIKTKMIEDILTVQDNAINNRPKREVTTVDEANCYEVASLCMSQEYNEEQEDVKIEDLKDEIKFLTSRIEQMEKLKIRTEEETSKTEDDLKSIELLLMKEREDYEVKSNSYLLQLEEVKGELHSSIFKCEELSMEIGNLHTALSKKKLIIDENLQDRRDLEGKSENLEIEVRKLKEERFEASSRLQKADNDIEELELQMQRVRADYDNDHLKFIEQGIINKNMQDKFDELNSALEKEMCEKNKLLLLISGGERFSESPFIDHDGLGLKIVEMRQRYDSQIGEAREQRQSLEIILREKDATIKELEDKIKDIKSANDVAFQVHGVVEDYKNNIEEIEKERERLLIENEENVKIIKIKENLLLTLKEENVNHEKELKEYKEKNIETNNENEKIKSDIEGLKDNMTNSCEKNEKLQQEIIKSNAKILLLEQFEVKSIQLEEQFTCIKNENECLEGQLSNLTAKYIALEKERFDLNQQTISLKESEDKATEYKESIDHLEKKLDAFKKYFKIFQSWNEEVIAISEGKESSKSTEYWTCDMEDGCDGIDEISSLGRWTGRLLLSWNEIHCQLKEKKILDNSKIDNFIEQIKNCLSITEGNTEITESDILERLSSLSSDVEKNSKLLFDMEESYRTIEYTINFDDFVDENTEEGTSSLNRLRRNIRERMACLNTLLADKENEISNLRCDNEAFSKKCEKLINNRLKQFKALANMFGLSNIDFEGKTFRKEVIQGLKEYESQRNRLSTELDEALFKLKEVEKEYEEKQSELCELREAADEDRGRLVSARLELEKFVDEKGRIDEEKQSLRKELNELNENIKNLKNNFEKEDDEKSRLENEFDELIEKIKANYLVLEHNYRGDIEESNCDDKIEKVINTEKENGSSVTGNNENIQTIKLEEVLRHSDRLIELNLQCKMLFEALKIDKINVIESLKLSELQVNELRHEIEMLSNGAEELRTTKDHVVKERDTLIDELDSLIREKERSIETIANLQSCNQNVDVEKSQFIEHIKDLEKINRETQLELELVKDSFETLKIVLGEERNTMLTLKVQLEEEQNNCCQFKNEIESLSAVMAELQTTCQHTTDEREMLRLELVSLTSEKEKSIESIANLQSINQNMEVEKTHFLHQINNLETVNRESEAEVMLVKQSFETLKMELEDVTRSRSTLISQLEDKEKKSFQLMNEIEMLSKNLEEQKVSYSKTSEECGALKIELESLIDEQVKSTESLNSLKSSNHCVEEEKTQSLELIRILEDKNHTSEVELLLVQRSLETIKGELKELEACEGKLLTELESERKYSCQLKDEIDVLINNLEEMNKSHEQVVKERDVLKVELDLMVREKEASVEKLVHLQNSNQNTKDEKSQHLEKIKQLESKNQASEVELKLVQNSLEEIRNELEDVTKYKCKLTSQLEEERERNYKLNGDIEIHRAEIMSSKEKTESIKMKVKKIKEDHKKEIFELKQQMFEEKDAREDSYNGRIKKLSNDFNDAILAKEQEFQKSFQNALDNARRDEIQQKSDFKMEMENLNEIVIELEIERNNLLSSVSDYKADVERSNSLLLTKESQIQSLSNEITSEKSQITVLEEQISKMKFQTDEVEQRSKLNQTVDSSICYGDESQDTVNFSDHDVLQMHCADLEEQVKHLHLENIDLKKNIALNQILTSLPPSQEPIVSATRSHRVTNQPSTDSISTKGSVTMNSGNLRSSNNSSSDCQFCPYPITESTEYDYLRDVLVKYMTGLETNTLARVLCTVMRLSIEETNRILQFEQDKKKVLQIQLYPR